MNAAKKQGIFITLEGGEGSGKSTQIEHLKSYFEALGRGVVLTREPGGTPEAEAIRALLVTAQGGDWSPMAEVLLLFAARDMHVRDLIRPALDEGKVVISDRFTDSTRAYQSYGHNLPLETVEEINETVLNGFAPDLTLILDIPAEQGLKRSNSRLSAEGSDESRFENMDFSFHEKLRQGYLDIAAKEPQRCVVIDAAQDMNAVRADIEKAIVERLKGRV